MTDSSGWTLEGFMARNSEHIKSLEDENTKLRGIIAQLESQQTQQKHVFHFIRDIDQALIFLNNHADILIDMVQTHRCDGAVLKMPCMSTQFLGKNAKFIGTYASIWYKDEITGRSIRVDFKRESESERWKCYFWELITETCRYSMLDNFPIDVKVFIGSKL